MRNKTIYYVGKRYLPELDHERFGSFKIAEDGEVTLPTPYADNLLANSSWLFTEKRPAGARKAPGVDYEKQPWFSLKKYAADRGIEVDGKKKDAIISELVALDAKEAEE